MPSLQRRARLQSPSDDVGRLKEGDKGILKRLTNKKGKCIVKLIVNERKSPGNRLGRVSKKPPDVRVSHPSQARWYDKLPMYMMDPRNAHGGHGT
jgi:hypothetical protein